MKHVALVTFGLIVASATSAHASSVSFYFEDTMSNNSETFIVTDSSQIAGPGVQNVAKRYTDPTSYSVPQFDPSLGTLNAVDIYFGVGSPSGTDNKATVSLDDDCNDCDKSLAVDLSFGFGLSSPATDSEGAGQISQFFDLSVSSFVESGDFDSISGNVFPSSGEVALRPGGLDDDYFKLSLTDATSLSNFTGGGITVFDVGPAIDLTAQLTCRDATGTAVTCSQEYTVDTGGTDWAAQFVYLYTPAFDPDLGPNQPDPGRIYTNIDGLQILPAGGGETNLRFFADNPSFTPEVVPLPAPMFLLLSAMGVLGVMRRRA